MKVNYNFMWIYNKTKGLRKYFLVLIIMGLLLAFVNIGMTITLKRFVDIAVGDLDYPLLNNALLAVMFIVLEGIGSMLSIVAFRVSTNKYNKILKIELSEKLYNSKLIDIQKKHIGEFMTNITNDVENVANCIPTIIRQTVGGGMSAILAIFYIFFLNWKLALMLLISIPLLILCVAIFSPIVQKVSKVDKKNEEDVRIYIQEMLQKIIILKLCSMESVIGKKLRELTEKKVDSSRKIGIAEGGSSFLNNIIGTAMMLIAIGGGSYFVSQGELLLGDMIAIISLSNYIIWPFTAVGDIISNANQSIISAQRLDNIYSLGEQNQVQCLAKKKENFTGLKLNQVSFGYDEVEILSNINAVFEANKIIGVIGESGGGKSTLLKIISGLYEPTNGSITAVHNEGAISGDNLLQYSGFVPPDNLVFRNSIKENICMAMPVDYTKMVNCAKMANIDEYINSLENKYETKIGEGEQTLSSGQAQRIAIARVLYQESEILLFDEPTSNLDIDSVFIFLQTLEQISKDHICIVVTHDQNVINHCQVLFEIEDGKLTACDKKVVES
ncbi:MAG: ABC transporter ATP-binding protein [Eubacteriales bacterium]